MLKSNCTNCLCELKKDEIILCDYCKELEDVSLDDTQELIAGVDED